MSPEQPLNALHYRPEIRRHDTRAQLHIRLSASDITALREVAMQTDRTISGVVRWLLKGHLRNRGTTVGPEK